MSDWEHTDQPVTESELASLRGAQGLAPMMIRLRDEVIRSRTLLRRIENISVEGEIPSCPDCHEESKAEFTPTGQRKRDAEGYEIWTPRHAPDCELAALLAGRPLPKTVDRR